MGRHLAACCAVVLVWATAALAQMPTTPVPTGAIYWFDEHQQSGNEPGAPDAQEESGEPQECAQPPASDGKEAEADSDGDGMPDAWEKANGLDPNDATGVNGADGDLDGDLSSNIYEWEIGTQPNDAGSGVSLPTLWLTARKRSDAFGEDTCELIVYILETRKTLTSVIKSEHINLPWPYKALDRVYYKPVDPTKNAEPSDTPNTERTLAFCEKSLANAASVRHVPPGTSRTAEQRLRRRINREARVPVREILWDESEMPPPENPDVWPFPPGVPGVLCGPLRTDVDMSMQQVGTWGKSPKQAAPADFRVPWPGQKMQVTVKLDGYLGLNAEREVTLSWPEGTFTATDETGNNVGHVQKRLGNQTFVWVLTRTDEEYPQGAKISAMVDSIKPGHPQYDKIEPVPVGD